MVQLGYSVAAPDTNYLASKSVGSRSLPQEHQPSHKTLGQLPDQAYDMVLLGLLAVGADDLEM